MPLWLRAIAEVMPVRHYLLIMRSVMLKGTGIRELWPHALVLVFYGFALLAISGRRMREWLSAG